MNDAPRSGSRDTRRRVWRGGGGWGSAGRWPWQRLGWPCWRRRCSPTPRGCGRPRARAAAAVGSAGGCVQQWWARRERSVTPTPAGGLCQALRAPVGPDGPGQPLRGLTHLPPLCPQALVPVGPHQGHPRLQDSPRPAAPASSAPLLRVLHWGAGPGKGGTGKGRLLWPHLGTKHRESQGLPETRASVGKATSTWQGCEGGQGELRASSEDVARRG